MMVKRLIAVSLSLLLCLSGCGQNISNNNQNISGTVENHNDSSIEEINSNPSNINEDELGDIDLSNASLNDEELLQYVEDSIYDDLDTTLESDKYVIENVSAIYVSKEYLEEAKYNSKSNIFFGYSLEDIEEQFDDEKYVFTVNDQGRTVVTKFENYDDTYDQIIKNVAIGSGVILVCVTVSLVTGGLGMPAVSAIFWASAKTGAEFAISSSVISGATTALLTGYQTHDIQTSLKAASLSASDAFKWGAISGAVLGGATKTLKLVREAKRIPSPRESEQYVLKKLGGEDQISFLNGKEVKMGTPGSTRPDVIIRNADGTVQAIEVKNCGLISANSRKSLYAKLEKEIADRVVNLPPGSTQKIILDTRNRKISAEVITEVIQQIQIRLEPIYPNIPIEVL